MSAATRQSWLRRAVFSTDHKVIGKQYLYASLLFLVVGGLLALIVRWQLAWPFDEEKPLFGSRWLAEQLFDGSPVMPSGFYAMAFTMHASVMIFLVVIPLLVGALGNYLVPLMVGARDMAFPFLNGLSFWVFVSGALTLLASFFLEHGYAAATGWTAYPPLSVFSPDGSDGQTLWIVGVLMVGTSSILGAINYVATIVHLRAPGLTWFRLPLTVWSLLVTSLLILFATPVLSSALGLLLMDRHLGTSFFLPEGLEYNQQEVEISGGGQVLLWQHLFWFYSHPAVYIMILPAMGMVSDVLATGARRPLFGYKPMVAAIAGIAVLGYLAWGHHMYQSGMNPWLGTAFMVSTIAIAIPSAVKVFNWIGTMWGGRIHFTPAVMFAIGFVSLFTIGGLSGIYMASAPVDIHIHDTYFIVAHIHYVLFSGSIFGVFAALYHWYPKMFGRHLHTGLGRLHFWGTFVLTNAVFFPMHVLGMAGYPRRYADVFPAPSLRRFNEPALLGQSWNEWITYAALALGVWQILFVVNFFGAFRFGRHAEGNPWRSNTLEWSTTSPPPEHNWDGPPPTVHGGPYDYADPKGEEDHRPQWEVAGRG